MKKEEQDGRMDYDPSIDDEFMKTIEQVLQEDEEEQRLNRIQAENNKTTQVIHNIDQQEESIKEVAANDEEAMVKEISDSLSKQVNASLQDSKKVETVMNKSTKRKKWSRILIPIILVCVFITSLALVLLYTDIGNRFLIRCGAIYVSNNTNYNDGSQDVVQEAVDITDVPDALEDLPMIETEDVDLKAEEGFARHEDYAVNILLLGEENIESGGTRGRTDVIIIATMNQKEKSLKLTSLMRDTLVQIPGHLDNKLNSAYQTGGISLLYETIELNFNIKLDGYCLVNFNSFEKIIDLLGGVDITLTQAEKNYLNKENYISNPKYRTVKTGINHMNGNQALGYCRVRYVQTANNEKDDFGRTSRARILLNAIFERYKTLDILQLANVANSCLPMITTDLDSTEIEKYLSVAIDIGLRELKQCRIPVDGAFEDANVRNMSVLVPDLQKNNKTLHSFIFGDDK